MGVTITGSKEIQARLRTIPSEIKKELPALLQLYGNNIKRVAKTEHRFISREYELEKSVTAEVSGTTLYIYLDNSRTTTEGYDYGLAIHHGTKYIKADPFLFNAFEKKEELLTKAVKRLIWLILTKK